MDMVFGRDKRRIDENEATYLAFHNLDRQGSERGIGSLFRRNKSLVVLALPALSASTAWSSKTETEELIWPLTGQQFPMEAISCDFQP